MAGVEVAAPKRFGGYIPDDYFYGCSQDLVISVAGCVPVQVLCVLGGFWSDHMCYIGTDCVPDQFLFADTKYRVGIPV